MTQLTEQQPTGQEPAEQEQSPVIPRPHTDAAALRALDHAKGELHERIEHIKAAPQDHHPKLVLSDQVRGTSLLDVIADGVNRV
ncbi:MAG: hypothetical protein WA805_12175, partial [Trebonia sp.]|uniref:hypothetical protein n=1 Tax=Trebonia sp. TaxID=2767075 RepID=UPI003C8354D9